MRKLIVPALLTAALAACSSSPTTEAPVEQKSTSTAPAVPESKVATVTPSAPTGTPWAALTDPNNILSKRSVFFDFDKYEIKPEFQNLIEAHAKFLNSQPTAKMLIQGNADERGSREYNLALGQKRAEAVRKALVLLGAKESQIEAVSLGEEKPRATGRDEESWAENRRGDMLYNGEY